MISEKLLREVYMTIGAASVCWEDIPAGPFLSDKAKALGDELVARIDAEIETARADERERIFDGIGKDREITARVMDAARADEREKVEGERLEALRKVAALDDHLAEVRSRIAQEIEASPFRFTGKDPLSRRNEPVDFIRVDTAARIARGGESDG